MSYASLNFKQFIVGIQNSPSSLLHRPEITQYCRWPSISCRCRQGVEQSAVNSHCCVNPAVIPSRPENSSIHRIFPTILVMMSAFWANEHVFDYVRWPCSFLTLCHPNLFCFFFTLHYTTSATAERQVLHNTSPSLQDCWLPNLVHYQLWMLMEPVQIICYR